ncbi:hypothetical protein LTR67_003955 [Exophiala xenobiotica]
MMVLKTSSGKWDVEKLKAMHVEDLLELPREALKELWTHLEPPEAADLNGDYEGYIHHASDKVFREEQLKEFYNLFNRGFHWLGKSFKTQADGKGEGFNRNLMRDGTIARMNRYITYPGVSVIDNEPVIILDYSPFDNAPSRELNMTGELRKLSRFNYLCVARSSKVVPGMVPRPRADGQGAETEFYLLGGPVAPYHEVSSPDFESKQTN